MRVSYMQAKAKDDTINKTVAATVERLGSLPNVKQRVSTAIAKRILLRYPTLQYNGSLYTTHTKSIGAGVHEVYLKLLQA